MKTLTKTKHRPLRVITSVVGILLCVILIPIMVMNITIIVKSYINPDTVPDFFGLKPFIVQTGSMEPDIYGGDLVFTKTVDPAKLQVGDVISYKEGNSVITHRIVELTEKDGEPAFITKGDANNTEDTNPVTYSQVESIYIFKISGMGNLAMFMQKPIGMFVFIGIPLCGFIIYDIIRRKLQDKKDSVKDAKARAEIETLKARLMEKEREAVNK